jgi:hypothetical protein
MLFICRITPEGCKPVSGCSPTAAWQELYKAAAGSTVSGASAAAAASVCGAKLFGLQHPVVQALVQALPNAAACDRFMNWQGEPPEPVLLVRRLFGRGAVCCMYMLLFVGDAHHAVSILNLQLGQLHCGVSRRAMCLCCITAA